MKMIDTYAVMGNPIAHSKSPFIHAEFAKQTHQHMHYTKIEVPLDRLEEYVTHFFLENGKGLNITVPFKQQAFGLVAEVTERATIAKAVNTIKFMENGHLYGDNTDGIGFIRDLTGHHHLSIANKSILILGAGGSVRGILHPILTHEPKEVILLNRTLGTAEDMADEFSRFGYVYAAPFGGVDGPVDLIINATSLGLKNEMVPLDAALMSEKTFCYDLIYGQELTPFLKWAVSNGCSRIADGVGMLVEQAAESFYIWRGVRPETKKVIEMLKHRTYTPNL